MAVYRVRVVLPYTTNLPRDVAVNTFHFYRATELDGPELAQLAGTFTRFYSVAPPSPGGVSLSSFIGTTVTRGTLGCRTEIYDLADPEPRPPVAVNNFTLGAAGGGTNLPLEVSVVNSFQGPRLAGSAQSRRRGRIFVGPLRSGAVDGTGTPVTATPLRQLLISASARLRDECIADVGGQWVVLSRVSGEVAPVSNGWVDDDPDTQRRRGLRTTNRLVWSI